MKKLLLLILLPAMCFADVKWEEVNCKFNDEGPCIKRLAVPHGWFIYHNGRVSYFQDEQHEWKV